MARLVYCHPSQTRHGYHIYTDLDFWDVRRLVKGLALVKRNFGQQPSGDEFPAQVVGDDLDRTTVAKIEGRLKKAIVSPPRHVIVRSMVFEEHFEFDPLKYYPKRWSKEQMLRFTRCRLPLDQSSLCNPYQTIRITWEGERIKLQRIQRDLKHDPVIRTQEEARRRLETPSCF